MFAARNCLIFGVFLVGCPQFSITAAEPPYHVAWSQQIGTSSSDSGSSVAVDAFGNVYISGSTQGSLGGPNVGEHDTFLVKYDSSGSLLWSQQIGTTSQDYGKSLAVDALGHVYIAGETNGSLGGPSAGDLDAFLLKYDSTGVLLWSQQIGTPGYDSSRAVAVDAHGNVYITGNTGGSLGGPSAGSRDAFLIKFDGEGTLLWSQQIGTSNSDYSDSVAVDRLGNAYISGYTYGSLEGLNAGSSDAFLVKYDGSGALLWSQQLGTSAGDFSQSIAVDALGNSFISGVTDGSLGGPYAGSGDAFLVKHDSSGNLLWSQQIGTSRFDHSRSVAVDANGNAYISGYTEGSLGGANAGSRDVFLVKYDSAGSLIWKLQIGTSSDDSSHSVTMDAFGNAYISGDSYGSLGAPNSGGSDAILVKFSLPVLAWTSLGGGAMLFEDPLNWSPFLAPIAELDASFTLDVISNVLLGASSSVKDIAFTDGTVNFVGDGLAMLNVAKSMSVAESDAASLNDAAKVSFGVGTSLHVNKELAVGRDGKGSLEALDSSASITAGRLIVGDGAGTSGSVTLLYGASLSLVASEGSPQVVVGANGGRGEIWISGGEFDVASEAGTVLIGQGAGSVGRIRSSEGATLRLPAVEIAVGAGAQGFLEADGDLIQASDLELGVGGQGKITLTRGAWLSQTGAGWNSEPTDTPGDAHLALVDDVGMPGEALVEVFSGTWDLGRGFWGVDGSASIDLSGGNVNASSDVSLGVNPGSFGKATLLSLSESHGAVQTLDVGGNLVVGAAGRGLLELLVPSEGESHVTVGGKLVIGEQAGTGDESVVTLDGVGSLLTAPDIEVGRGGRGWLQVGDLGALEAGAVTAAQVALGITPTGHGKLSVAGAASVLDTDELMVGSLGKGVVEIVAAGHIRATQRVFLGADSASLEANELLVSGRGSLLEANRIHVGDAGRGTLLVNDGGAVDAANFVAAHDAGSRGEVVVDGVGSRITARDLGISTLGEATLAITNGGLVEASRRFWAGYGDDGTASVVVDGVGSLLDIGAGSDPQRGLLIGGEPTAAGGQGTLTISDGARLNAREEVLVGPNATADGTLVVTGGGSLADFTNADATDDLTSVGAAGTGRLQVLDGGVVLSELGVVGAGSDAVGNVHVSGDGSAWQTNLLAVGGQGAAEVVIDYGGRVATVLDAYLAREAGSDARVTVGGKGQAPSVFQIGDGLYVGGDQGSSGGTASVEVLANGRVEVAQNLTVRPQGRVAVKGGALTVDGEVALKGELALVSGALSIGQILAAQQVDFQDLFAWNAGELTLTSQGLRIDAEGPLGATVNLVPGKTLVTEGGGLDNQGLLNIVSTSAAFRGAASVNSPTGTINVTEGTLEVADGLVNEGTLSLFDASVLGSVANALGSEATLSGSNSVSGAYAMGPFNNMSVRVRSQSNASRLDVGGVATLGGAVNVTLIGGYLPTLGQSIAFVEAAELVGEFATENLPRQHEGVAFYASYTDTTASLLATYPTDFSADGEVGEADFAHWQSGFGPRFAAYKAGDANEDGAADGFDLLAWQRQFGLTVPAATAAVPEADSLLTVAMALLALVATRQVFGKALAQ